uniref:PAR14-like first RRM domain-containing protein n=1 Tax=Astyanax mexicanus TaxID=7994 RepID=A0A3B1JA16_ASTMX
MSGMDEFPYPLTVEGPWPATSTKILTSKLQIYFQSRKKSQGGDCEVKICEQSGIATVRFKSEETRDQVLAKGNHSINIEKQVVKLKVFKPSDAENQTQAASGAVSWQICLYFLLFFRCSIVLQVCKYGWVVTLLFEEFW